MTVLEVMAHLRRSLLFQLLVYCAMAVVVVPAQSPQKKHKVEHTARSQMPYKVMAGDQPGKDVGAKLSNCISVVVSRGGGWCDGSDLPVRGVISHEIDIGNKAGAPIHLTLPAGATWTVSIDDPNQYGLRIFSGAVIDVPHNGALGTFQINTQPGAHVKSLVATDPVGGPGGSSYIILRGISALDPGKAVSANGAVIEIQNLFDVSRIENTYAGNFSGRGLWVHQVCCATTMLNVGADGSGNQGAQPCEFGGVAHTEIFALTVIGLSCVHPGKGKNAILMDWAGGRSGIRTLHVHGIYLEENATGDTTTPFISMNGVRSAELDGVTLGAQADGGSRYLVEITNAAAGRPQTIILRDLYSGAAHPALLDDRMNSRRIEGANHAYLAEYIIGDVERPQR